MMERIVLIGGGGHAHSIMDTLIRCGQYEIAGYTERCGEKSMGTLRMIGTDDDLERIYSSGIQNAAVAIGYLGKGDIRERIYIRLKQIGYRMPVIIDTSAVISDSVSIGEGTYVGKRAVVNANTQVGKMCIVNTGTIVEHDTDIGSFSHLAPGSVLCGGVRLGKGVLVGANATVIQGVSIGDGAVAGAGTTVRHDIERGQVYYGR